MRKYFIILILMTAGVLVSCHSPSDSSECESEVICIDPNDYSKGRVMYMHCTDSIYVFDGEGKLLRKVSTGKK